MTVIINKIDGFDTDHIEPLYCLQVDCTWYEMKFDKQISKIQKLTTSNYNHLERQLCVMHIVDPSGNTNIWLGRWNNGTWPYDDEDA